MTDEPEIIIKDNPAQLAREGADIFALAARDSVAGAGRFVVALSGGSTPRAIHRMLAKQPYRSAVDWEKTHIFWVDERCVPETDPVSNYGTAKKDFLDDIPIPSGQVHPMPGSANPQEGATQYREELEAFFGSPGRDVPSFDLIFLGIGTDGHTASLFPGQRSMVEPQTWVAAVKGGNPDVYRITLTYSLLNRGKRVTFLVTGKEKALVVKEILERGNDQLPAGEIKPANGELVWVLDLDAASRLSGEDRP